VTPLPASAVTRELADTLGDTKLVGASISNGRTPCQFPATGAPQVLDITGSTTVRTEFLEEGFSGTGHKKTPRNLNRLPGETSTSGILAGYSAHTLTLRARELALCQNKHNYTTGRLPIGATINQPVNRFSGKLLGRTGK